ncbi:hypothetical protein [Terrimonas alba]|uniref:hypothetical protein n=1 Tax=Terrimonas alba TaxID=3349636 RepID=UPI0035F32A19
MSEKKTYNALQMASAVFMIMALLWLTISAPFVYAGQQEITKQSKATATTADDDDCANPFGNNTEEKAPGNSSSFSEEYLHDQHHAEHFFSIIFRFHKCENADTYHAFHGELLVPPPNAA